MTPEKTDMDGTKKAKFRERTLTNDPSGKTIMRKVPLSVEELNKLD